MFTFAEQNEAQEKLKKEQEDVFEMMKEYGFEASNEVADPTDEKVTGNMPEEGFAANEGLDPTDEGVDLFDEETIAIIKEYGVETINNSANPTDEKALYAGSQLNQEQQVPQQHGINQGDQIMPPVNTTQPTVVIPPQATLSLSDVLYQNTYAERRLPSPKSLAPFAISDQDYHCIQSYIYDVSWKIKAVVTEMNIAHGFFNDCPFDWAYDGARYLLSSLYPGHLTYGTRGIFSFHLPYNDFVQQLPNMPKYIYPTTFPCIAPPGFIENVAQRIWPIVTGLNYRYGLRKECSWFDASTAAKLILGKYSYFQPSPFVPSSMNPSNSHPFRPFHPYAVQPPPSGIPSLNRPSPQYHLIRPYLQYSVQPPVNPSTLQRPVNPSTSQHNLGSYPPNSS